MDHLDQSSLSERSYQHIDEEETTEYYQDFEEVIFVYKFCKGFEELIFLMKNNDIGEGYLVEENQQQPKHPYKRRDKIQFLERMKSRDELPCGENDRFFHSFSSFTEILDSRSIRRMKRIISQ